MGGADELCAPTKEPNVVIGQHTDAPFTKTIAIGVATKIFEEPLRVFSAPVRRACGPGRIANDDADDVVICELRNGSGRRERVGMHEAKGPTVMACVRREHRLGISERHVIDIQANACARGAAMPGAFDGGSDEHARTRRRIDDDDVAARKTACEAELALEEVVCRLQHEARDGARCVDHTTALCERSIDGVISGLSEFERMIHRRASVVAFRRAQ